MFSRMNFLRNTFEYTHLEKNRSIDDFGATETCTNIQQIWVASNDIACWSLISFFNISGKVSDALKVACIQTACLSEFMQI